MSLTPVASPLAPARFGVLAVGTLPEPLAAIVARWSRCRGLQLTPLETDEMLCRKTVHDAEPVLVLVGAAAGHGESAGVALRELKRDSRLQSIPAVVLSDDTDAARWLAAGADEVLTDAQSAEEVDARLTAALRRSRRDVQVNPSTRLAGADAIADAIAERVESNELFAACYADLDHFKEFNDRYGYAKGDDVIRSVAALLLAVVDETAGADGFVGHIGGDDFLFLVPLEDVERACDLVVRRADEMLPARYSAHDRQAGYFFGKDRRGRLDRVPLMTLSIGVVTNERRRFTNAAQVSELATEMKTYAKTLPGSVWAMDRRSDGDAGFPPEEKHQ
jgi:GGDEF domain-containing protein